jgi:hypothetical protein
MLDISGADKPYPKSSMSPMCKVKEFPPREKCYGNPNHSPIRGLLLRRPQLIIRGFPKIRKAN